MENKKIKSEMPRTAGFTLIEILVVIGLIAILAAIVIIAINPARQFAQGRNTQRTANVNTILNAIGQKMADNKGTMADCLGSITGTATKIATGTGNVDLSCLTGTGTLPSYVPSLPFDPIATGAHWADATDYDTGYNVFQDANGRITVSAPAALAASELSQTITVTR